MPTGTQTTMMSGFDLMIVTLTVVCELVVRLCRVRHDMLTYQTNNQTEIAVSTV